MAARAFPPCLPNIFLGNAANGSETLSALVPEHLDKVVRALPPPELNTGCLLADIGNYLVRSVAILSRLSGALANGDHIKRYASSGIEFIDQGTGFSDLNLTYYMNGKHQALREIANQIAAAAQGVESHWEHSSTPPETLKAFGKRPAAAEGADGTFAPDDMVDSEDGPQDRNRDTEFGEADDSACPSSATITSGPSESPYSAEDAGQASIQRQLSLLSTRGKGNHQCPLGARCTKGGAQSDGTIVTFERNSAFKAHLQKHEKVFKCGIPGCKNTKGFARIDQLQRHRENVHHQGPGT